MVPKSRKNPQSLARTDPNPTNLPLSDISPDLVLRLGQSGVKEPDFNQADAKHSGVIVLLVKAVRRYCARDLEFDNVVGI